ncbi:hypothetical protein [Tenacibaculum finnmarkense]|uniref:hypothetical protein n=1 Tax=Tenacibaculum finnmarkense TaxID=2781243 RepID=UPI00187B6C25|nr:hypothetical protein [Tenacibaculum finnmarkense]MBE7659243.1 hypothetical protein [Tenacibaculum finnmarkense genomovar finnmarkense]MCG8251334.1 hypothetical protein [Tenacibaculum finnmarkense genomovar finnmarkense]MCG8814448.1 hypothetical protein [Tenacibaculum finnmarkense]MCG8819468.1 hypothetical protein [Tenacibaculum finnmarkense]
MKIIKNIVIVLLFISLSSCTSLDTKVKEYREIKNKMGKIHENISDGIINKASGIKELTALQIELSTFEREVSSQYSIEENIIKDIEIKRKKAEKTAKRVAEIRRTDSIKQARFAKREAFKAQKKEAKLAREEALKNKLEVAEMIKAEQEAERNAYINELKGAGLFLVSFNGESYEINKKEWEDWKKK